MATVGAHEQNVVAVIASGDICPDGSGDHVAVLSTSRHLAMRTGWVITCPFVPGIPPADASARRLVNDAAISSGIVTISRPEGVLLPELIRCVPASMLGESVGTVDAVALREAISMVTALIGQ